MDNIYLHGFDFERIQPTGKNILIKAILPSDFDSLVETDVTETVSQALAFRVVSLGPEVKGIERDDDVLVLKAAIDSISPSAPRWGIVEQIDIRAIIK